MIKTVSFYKNTNKEAASKKLQNRINLKNFTYEKCLSYIQSTFELYNPNNKFIIASDQTTDLSFTNSEIIRYDLDKFLIMEAITRSNTNYILNNTGKMVMIGADHLISNPVDIMFEEEFDLAFWITHREFEPTHRLNLSMTMFLVNKDNNNEKKINKFFKDRENICFSLPVKERKWFADQKSIALLLEQKNIITDYFKNNRQKTVFDFYGLKIKLFTYGKDFISPINDDGTFNVKSDTVLVDFPGHKSKEFLDDVYQLI